MTFREILSLLHRPSAFRSEARTTRSLTIVDISWEFCRLARPAGLEPATPGLEGRCSIQLSYGRKLRDRLYPNSNLPSKWSGQRDSNPRPSAPKADALPDCAMPRPLDSSCRHRGADHTDRPTGGQFDVAFTYGARLCLWAHPRAARRRPRADRECGRTRASCVRCARPPVLQSTPRSGRRSRRPRRRCSRPA